MTSADLIRELEKAGWRLVRTRGSHHAFQHPRRPGTLIVPHPRKAPGEGLVAAVHRQANPRSGP